MFKMITQAATQNIQARLASQEAKPLSRDDGGTGYGSRGGSRRGLIQKRYEDDFKDIKTHIYNSISLIVNTYH